jgi:phosphoribosyl 1,2-cyclic phosphodiesterase
MDNSVIVPLINDDCRLMKVAYEDGGSASIMKTLDPTIKVDDLVVVQSGTRWEMTVAKVTEVDIDINFEIQRDVKWIVTRICEKTFDHIKSMEVEAINAVQAAEKKRKKDELRASVMAHHEQQINSLQIANMASDVVADKDE